MKKIIIIGAGIAGLAAAKKLQSTHLAVTVLEGRNRIGGRINTDYSLGIPFDAGASWLHGTEDNPLANLAKQLNLKLSLTDFFNCYFIDRHKKQIPLNKFNEFYRNFELLSEQAILSTKENDCSFFSAINAITKTNQKSEDWQDMFNWSLLRQAFYSGAEANFLSAQGLKEETILAGGNFLFLNGYQTIINELAENSDIQLNTTVNHIKHSKQAVKISTNRGEFSADAVIITLPLGVLQKQSVTFDPPLPSAKQKSIANLQMGILNKVALKFPAAFWPANYHALYFTPLEKKSISSYINFSGLYNQPILVGYIAGEKARRFEKFSDETLITMTMEGLRNIFEKNIPDPEAYYTTRWAEDPLSCGSYSYIPVGASGKDYDILAEPVDNLFFAGEATCRQYLATTHGAYLSGIREAERIIELQFSEKASNRP